MDFRTSLAAIRKEQPGAGDVHVASARWTAPRRKVKKQSLYIHRPLTNALDLHKWAQDAGIPNLVPPEEMHATIMYSKNETPGMNPEADQVTATGGKRSIEKLGDKGAVVLKFESPVLQDQHQTAKTAGAAHSFAGFIPHVTLSYDAGAVDLAKLTPPAIALEFGPEVHAPVNEDWAEDKGLRKFEFRVPITKTEVRKTEDGGDQNLVFGWASIVEKDGQIVIDVQDDMISEADLEEAFYGFVKNARNAGEMHADSGSHIGTCIECMVFTKEKQKLMKIDLGFVGAWVGFEVASEIFAKVKDGSYPEFSIGGEGVRVKTA